MLPDREALEANLKTLFAGVMPAEDEEHSLRQQHVSTLML
jgi:hypothetical protein